MSLPDFEKIKNSSSSKSLVEALEEVFNDEHSEVKDRLFAQALAEILSWLRNR